MEFLIFISFNKFYIFILMRIDCRGTTTLSYYNLNHLKNRILKKPPSIMRVCPVSEGVFPEKVRALAASCLQEKGTYLVRLEGLSLAAEGDVAVGLPLEELAEHGLYVGVVVLPPQAVLLGEAAVAVVAAVAPAPATAGSSTAASSRALGEPRGRLLWGLVRRCDRSSAHHRVVPDARGVVVVIVEEEMVLAVGVVVAVLGGGTRGRRPRSRYSRRRRRGCWCRVGRAAPTGSSSATTAAASAAAAAGPRHCQRR